MTCQLPLLLRHTLGAALLLLSSTLMASSASQSLADVPVPLGTQLQSVGTDIVQNGQAMAVATYESPLPLADTVAYYHRLWVENPAKTRPGLVENREGEWLILGRLQDELQIVLQLRQAESHKSSGYLSVMSIEASDSVQRSGATLPGLEHLSTTQSQDGGRASVLSVYASPESVETLARQFAGHWQDQGWTLVSDEAYAQSRILLLNHASAQLEIVIIPDTGESSIVVMNEVDDHG